MSESAVIIPAPASKSLSHRYLIAAALANGRSWVRNVLDSADLEATRGVLCAAGARMKPLHQPDSADIDGFEVLGVAGLPRGGEVEPTACDVQESGTTCRLLTAVLAAGQGLFRIFGSGRMHERPIGELCDVLEQLGAKITYEGKPGCPPLLLEANRLNPVLADGYVKMGMDQSSQYFSGLLMAAPMALAPLTIELGGRKAVSWPYVGLTLRCMDDFGIRFSVEQRPGLGAPWISLQKTTWRNLTEVRPGGFRVRVWPGEYRPGAYTVEGDWSGASYFLAAGAIGRRPVTVTGLDPQSPQGDRAIIDILRQMGAQIVISGEGITVYPSTLHGVSLDMGSCPDLVPTVAVLAAYAKGSTRIYNVAHLRIKESDRIEAPARELSRTGVVVDPLADGLLINGLGGGAGRGPIKRTEPVLPEGCVLGAHNDHRIAMSLALLGLRDPAVNMQERLDEPLVVRKSFPQFWTLWERLQ